MLNTTEAFINGGGDGGTIVVLGVELKLMVVNAFLLVVVERVVGNRVELMLAFGCASVVALIVDEDAPRVGRWCVQDKQTK